jgi:hypothetical protein
VRGWGFYTPALCMPVEELPEYVLLEFSFREPRIPEVQFPRRTLLGSSLNKRAATIRPPTGVAISRARVSNTYYA